MHISYIYVILFVSICNDLMLHSEHLGPETFIPKLHAVHSQQSFTGQFNQTLRGVLTTHPRVKQSNKVKHVVRSTEAQAVLLSV